MSNFDDYVSSWASHATAIILGLIVFVGVIVGSFQTHDDFYVALPLGLLNAIILAPIAYGIGRIGWGLLIFAFILIMLWQLK